MKRCDCILPLRIDCDRLRSGLAYPKGCYYEKIIKLPVVRVEGHRVSEEDATDGCNNS